MKNILWIIGLSLAGSALGADCIFYKNNDRTGDSYPMNAGSQTVELQNGWNDTISSVWVRNGSYTLVAKDYRFQGVKAYFYGSGIAFSNNTWLFDKSKDTADGGMLFDFVPFGFNDAPTSLLCVKE